jgi:hypothetical protein
MNLINELKTIKEETMLTNLFRKNNQNVKEVKKMNKLKTIVCLMAITVMVMFTSSISHALSLTPGTFLIKFNNYETLVTQTGDTLSGIFKVTSITDYASNPLWADHFSDGTEITGQFGGLNANVSGPDINGDFNINFTNGWINIYQDAAENFDPTYPGVGVTDGELILQLAFVPGIIPGDFTTTMNANLDGLTYPAQGEGFGYLDVIGGTHAAMFDTDGMLTGNGTYADLYLHSNFNIPQGGSFGWPVASFDPMEGNVPEPGTIMLLGAGLIGAGFFGKKKMIK